jgi:hypothetical protein
MDAISDADLNAALDRAYAEAAEREPFTGIHYVAESIRHLAKDKDDPLAAVLWGLDYHLIAYQDQRDNGPYGPMMEGGGLRYPAPIEAMGDEVYALWARAAELSPAALIAARFYDLLWQARYGEKPVEWVWQAIDAYSRAIADGWGHGVDLADAGRRAYELALSVGDAERRAMVVERILDLIGASLGNGTSPGVDLPLLDLLAEEPDIERGVLMGIVDKAIDIYAGDAWHLDSALAIKAKLSESAEVDALRRRQVEAFADLANRSDGLVRFAHLRRAVEMAENFGFANFAEELRAEAESMTDDEIGLKKVSAEVTIPRDAIDAWVQEIVGDDRIEDALLRFGSHIPSGDPEDTRRFVKEQAIETPLLSILPRMTIGPENALLRVVNATDQEEQAMIDFEARSISIFGLFAVDTVDAIRARYGPLAEVAASLFQGPLVDEGTARHLARCVGL